MKTTDYNTQIFGSNDRQVFAIIVYCLLLAFSVLVASLETVQSMPTGFSFVISWRTLFAFTIAAAVLVPCFKAIFHCRRKDLRMAPLALVCGIGVGAFLYPLRFVPTEKFADIFLGLLVAAFALSGIGGMLFAINRFLNADAQSTEITQSEKGEFEIGTTVLMPSKVST